MAETSPDLSGSTALVTGSTSGIGLGIAEALAAHGASIVMNGMGSPDQLDAAVGQVSRHGTSVVHHTADLQRPDQIKHMMDFAEGEFGGLDILVNNAGVQKVAPIEDFPLDDWSRLLAVNLTAPFLTTQHALPGMRERDMGRIINVASTHGLVASIHKAAYCASKAGLVALTKVTALETAGTGVTANALCPGWVLTPLVEQQVQARMTEKGMTYDEAKADLLGEKQPSGEFVTVEELGRMAVFLADPRNRSARGAQFVLDGAWTAQ